ncbi:MAG: cation-transporting P-type ATPase [Candidatus Krumholzibacteriia bacterium]
MDAGEPGTAAVDPADFHALTAAEVLERLQVDPERGLDRAEVDRRRREHGLNALREAETRSVASILIEQFKSVVIIILLVAGVLALVMGEIPEAAAIAAVLAVNAAIGFFSEWKAERSMQSLRVLEQPTVRVRREGEVREVAADELVPGDLVEIAGGELVPADLRLVDVERLRVNEAALTGESVPAPKTVDPVEADAPVADRCNLLFRGTSVTDGEAVAVVVRTGMQTELGRISELAATAGGATAPLQQRLDRLGSRLAWIVLGVAVGVAAAGLLAGRDTRIMLETAIALGVAAIPEGLPIVATIALARGMWHMARRNAVVNRLTAVETLGATSVIFTDKTGTLTENRMILRRIVTPTGDHDLGDAAAPPAPDRDGAPPDGRRDPAGHPDGAGHRRDAGHPDHDAGADGGIPDDPLVRRIIEVGVLCNGASLGDDPDAEEDDQGDPTELAFLYGGLAAGLQRTEMLHDRPQERVAEFDPDVMMMATFHRISDTGREGAGETDAAAGPFTVAVKGAPDRVLEACTRVAGADGDADFTDDDRRHWSGRQQELAGEGLRMLALADKQVSGADAEPYTELRFLGLAGLLDPARGDVREAIDRCQEAGIRVIMLTGDQPATAAAIGEHTGLPEEDGVLTVLHARDLGDLADVSDERRREILAANVFARVSPEQKLQILSIYQDDGRTVAMTGDGVNDAPALKKADIGIAMGRRGTDAARQVSDMVLRDDAFSSIVAAVQQGRIIFANIRRSVMFMLCTNVAEILAITAATLAQAPLPLLPLQILYLNVVTDVFPALALGLGEGDPRIMQEPPRPRAEPVLTRRHWLAVLIWAVVVGGTMLGALAIALAVLGLDQRAAVTISFLTLAFSKLWFPLNLRERRTSLLDNDIVRNPWIWGAIALCIVLLLAAVYVPFLAAVLRTTPPTSAGWGVILGMSLVPVAGGQIYLGLAGRREARRRT